MIKFEQAQQNRIIPVVLDSVLLILLNTVFDGMYVFPDPRQIKMFVLDEADEMLSRGFKDQIYDVFQFMPENIQVGELSFSS